MEQTSEELKGKILADKYQLVDRLRPGMYGDIWSARRLSDYRAVSAKLLRPELLTDGQAIVRFERETRVIKKLSHPNLLRVLDEGRTELGSPFIIFEHRDGRLLSEDIAFGTLDVEKICHITLQIGAVLAAAHAKGVVHRGLHPDAILLCEDGSDEHHVKVLDFGLAHLTPDSGEAGLTRVGQRLGHPEYLAPEYIGDNILDARSDVYSLGIITYQMITGSPPFTGKPLQIISGHIEKMPPPPSSRSTGEVPDWLDRLVLAMLAKDPDDRPQSGLQVARAMTHRKFPL